MPKSVKLSLITNILISMSEEHDILIKNGIIVDGTGNPPYKGALSVKDQQIQAVGEVSGDLKGDARIIIDANGKAVSPGFIDVHNHVDLSILYYPLAQSFVMQGITSFVGGHCGDSAGPYNEYIGEPWFYIDIYQDVSPKMGRNEWLIPKDDFNVRHKELYGWEVDWDTMAGYFKRVEETGLTPNMIPLVGHGDLRSFVMGIDYKRYAKKKEIKEMQKLTEKAMLDGCCGLSVGRGYEPGSWANFEEILACAKVSAKYGGIYNSHCLRSGPRGDKKPSEAPLNPIYGVLEAIDIGRKAKMSVQISHLGNQFTVNPPDNDIMTEAAIKATLKTIDDANEEGLNVHFDVIPHHQSGGIFSSPYLIGIFSKWLKIAGSPKQLVNAFRMDDLREEIKENINSGKMMQLNPNTDPLWAEKRYILEHKKVDWVHKNILEIAEMLKISPVDALFNIITEDPMCKVQTIRNKDDWVKLEYYKHPNMMVGCDTFAVDDKAQNRHPSWMLPSQNAFGGHPGYLKRIIRETGFLSMEEAVRKITSLPANKFKIKDRGILRPGSYADITIWDPEIITDMGTAAEPRQYPKGIDYVIINGEIVVKKGKQNKVMPGKILYREN